MQAKKPVCPHCGQVHDETLDNLTDIAGILATSFKKEAFPMIWKDVKKNMKEMKRKEIAEEMFHIGATQMLTAFIAQLHDESFKNENIKPS